MSNLDGAEEAVPGGTRGGDTHPEIRSPEEARAEAVSAAGRRTERWRRAHLIEDLSPFRADARSIFEQVRRAPRLDPAALRAILRRHPLPDGAFYSKNLLVRVYQGMCAEGSLAEDPEILRRLRMKPVRTLSGVAPVTILTKPFPCPGECIFCPTEPDMPKSYIAEEPGAQRAAQNRFDPQAQVENRIRALRTNGHPVDKVEILILGGTWSSYPREYQESFVRRSLDALNGAASPSLEEAQKRNETAPHRNTGLVIETRPDAVSAEEVRWLRRLGVTKVQMGAQSLDDAILLANRRGHDVESTRAAMSRLRAAGIKLVLHWMPNLAGATPEGDVADFSRLFDDPALRPDEIKIYPCALLPGTPLLDLWRDGGYRPYEHGELVDLIAACKLQVPDYCRINRVHRDIPSTHVVAGNRRSNLREDVRALLVSRGQRCRCIRCREVRGTALPAAEIRLRSVTYPTTCSQEVFLSFEDPSRDLLAGYLRLSLPQDPPDNGIEEIVGAALVREVHIYGQALGIGSAAGEEAQHRGLGTRLLEEAADLSRSRGFRKLAVIASVGTRGYYASRGFALEGTYMVRGL